MSNVTSILFGFGVSCRTRVMSVCLFFFIQAEDGIRDHVVTGVQTFALPIAEEILQAVIKTRPRFPDAISALGDLYLRKGQSTLAVAKWEEAIQLTDK